MGRECGFISWGQQAHASGYQAGHESMLMYLTRFKDCGNGVIETTWGFHNAAQNGDTLRYLNIPWAGWRPSVFRDFLVGQKPAAGKARAELIDPIPGWAGDPRAVWERYGYGMGMVWEWRAHCGQRHPSRAKPRPTTRAS